MNGKYQVMDTNNEDIIRIRSEVERLQLDGWEFVIAVTLDSLLKSYNGTGPDNLPEASVPAPRRSPGCTWA